MATYFLSSVDGSDSDNGSDWSLAKATWAGAIALITADGDILKVDRAHSESPGAAISVTLPSVKWTMQSVNRAGSDAPLAGADITPGTGAHAFTINNGSGDTDVYGMEFVSANNSTAGAELLIDTANGNDGGSITFRNCKLKLLGTSANAQMLLGTPTMDTGTRRSRIVLDGSEITLPNRATGASLQIGHVRLRLQNRCTFAYNGATHPTPIFTFGAVAAAPEIEIVDCDLSNLDTGNLFDVANFVSGRVVLRNVALHASMGLVTGTWPVGNGSITCINVDSGDTFTTFSYRDRYGTLTQSTSIYANDNAQFGGTNMGVQVVTSAACDEHTPFVVRVPLKVWNEVLTAVTVTIEFVHDSATAMHNRNIWSNLRYIGDASLPIGEQNSNRNASPFLGATANHGAGAATWTGTGGFANENKQKLSHSITADEKGALIAEIFVGLGSKTLYIDPQIRVA